MPQQAITHHSLALAWFDKLRAEDIETGEFLFIHAARRAKIQFAPHRLVGNYADYGKFAASKALPFG